ncbi:MAG: class I SAM-dependent methyltransferase, partial [Deltaproteobacteria bacterium]|nr:class I SAM-dependent methyltransferase [Deltaproteobacteria bacterium]
MVARAAHEPAPHSADRQNAGHGLPRASRCRGVLASVEPDGRAQHRSCQTARGDGAGCPVVAARARPGVDPPPTLRSGGALRRARGHGTGAGGRGRPDARAAVRAVRRRRQRPAALQRHRGRCALARRGRAARGGQHAGDDAGATGAALPRRAQGATAGAGVTGSGGADPTGWFEPLYAAAGDGSAVLPWARGGPHPLLAPWTSALGLRGDGRPALVVGSGPGDDAELVAALGFDTLAFDIAPSAIRMARARFLDSAVDYRTADLLDPPVEWEQAFELVVEIFTVQSLPDPPRARAIMNVGRM